MYDAVTGVGDDIVEDAARAAECAAAVQKQAVERAKKRRTRLAFAAPIAAVLAIAVLLGAVLLKQKPGAPALAEPLVTAVLPGGRIVSAAGEFAPGVKAFMEKTARAMLEDASGENSVYSPLSLYMALGMLAEVTDTTTRQQILDLLGSDDIEQQREAAKAIFASSYLDNEHGKSLLAASVWMDRSYDFNMETMQRLADSYYASSFKGDPGSDAMNKLLRKWLNDQTYGELKEFVDNEKISSDCRLALVSSLYMSVKWRDAFSEQATAPAVFHAEKGGVTADFMHGELFGAAYFEGERFTAAAQPALTGQTMWYVLPREGVTLTELASDAELMEFLAMDGAARSSDPRCRTVRLTLSVPKFDVSKSTDLIEMLRSLGVTEALLPGGDFSPATVGPNEFLVSKADQNARLRIDEKGCVAAAYTKIEITDGALPVDFETVEFTLDRPFIFSMTAENGLPMFLGSVADPTAK